MFVCRCSGRFNRFSGVYSHCSSLPGRNKHSDCVTLQVSRQLTQNVRIKLKKLSISLKRNRFDIVWFWSLRFLRQKTEKKHNYALKSEHHFTFCWNLRDSISPSKIWEIVLASVISQLNLSIFTLTKLAWHLG